MPEHPEQPERLLAAAEAVGEVLRAGAAKSESNGALVPEVDTALRDAGLYQAFIPSELGGLGADPLTLLRVVESVASHDGSAGWCVGTCGMIGGFAALRLPEAGAQEVFGGGGNVVAGGYVPRCRAEAVEGGYRVSGRMAFASGCRNADWFLVTGLVVGAEGFEAWRSFLLPPSDATILDNWHVAGLEGSSSNDLEVDDVFVPAARSFSPMADAPVRGGPEWHASVLAVAAIAHLGFSLGVPRRALEEIRAHATRQRIGSTSPIAERQVVQRDYARARARLQGARLLAFDAFGAVIEARGEPSLEQRADLGVAIANAYAAATDVCEFAFRAGGATSLYRNSALQRCFRDAQAGAQHIVAADEAFERAGRVFLTGEDPGFI